MKFKLSDDTKDMLFLGSCVVLGVIVTLLVRSICGEGFAGDIVLGLIAGGLVLHVCVFSSSATPKK